MKKRRKGVLSTVERLLNVWEYGAASLRDTADELGISTREMTYHFPAGLQRMMPNAGSDRKAHFSVDIPGKIWYHTATYHTTMLVEFIESGRTYMEEKEGALGFATRAVHVGNDVDKDSGAIKRPITMANSYALPYDPTDMNWSSARANPFEEVERADGFKALSIPLDAPDGAQEVSYATIGGVLSFGLNADHDTHNRLVSHLKVIPSAVSLGENDERQYLYPPEFHKGFFRFSVGIEDKEDILADLKQAMTQTGLETV